VPFLPFALFSSLAGCINPNQQKWLKKPLAYCFAICYDDHIQSIRDLRKQPKFTEFTQRPQAFAFGRFFAFRRLPQAKRMPAPSGQCPPRKQPRRHPLPSGFLHAASSAAASAQTQRIGLAACPLWEIQKIEAVFMKIRRFDAGRCATQSGAAHPAGAPASTPWRLRLLVHIQPRQASFNAKAFCPSDPQRGASEAMLKRCLPGIAEGMKDEKTRQPPRLRLRQPLPRGGLRRGQSLARHSLRSASSMGQCCWATAIAQVSSGLHRPII
jgi:hypothetical protein